MGRTIFIAGGTGYVGASLIPQLLDKGHKVRALCRQGSEGRVASGAEAVVGNALDSSTYTSAGCDTFVHLVGTPHPAPWKGAQFRAVDLIALKASVISARSADLGHFVYVSVAHPAPVMQSYIDVRRQCEQIIAESCQRCTILRPWYVLGPGHRWPVALVPAYWLAERVPGLRDGARRLGLVTLKQMVAALAWAVDNPPSHTRTLNVPDIASKL